MPEWIWHWSGYAVALLALVGVVWALFLDRPRGRKRCRRCWYDMSGASDVPVECPECGRAHAKPKHLTRTRRRWGRAVVLGLVMVVGGYGLWVVPRVQDEGAWGLAPTTGLFSFAPFVDIIEAELKTYGSDDMKRKRFYNSLVETRASAMPPVAGAIAWHWLKLWDSTRLGQVQDPSRVVSGREALVVQGALPRSMLETVAVPRIDCLLRRESLQGVVTRGPPERWSRPPSLPAGWSVDRLVPGEWPILFESMGRTDQASWFNRVRRGGVRWTHHGPDREPLWALGDELTFRVTLFTDDWSPIAAWMVKYEVSEGDSEFLQPGETPFKAVPVSIEAVEP